MEAEHGQAEVSRAAGPRPLRALAIGLIALLELLLCLSLFGPQELGWLWVGSQVDFATDSLSAGLAVAFIGSVTTIVLTVWVGRRLELVWQRLRDPVPEAEDEDAAPAPGLFEATFVISTVLGVIGFAIWFFVIAGPGPTIAPGD